VQSLPLKLMPDIVLSDISMPVMSGFELLERLTALAPRFGNMPFVFLTALTDHDHELRGRQLGADDLVTKPIDFDVRDAIIGARITGVARNQLWPKLVGLHDREVEALTWSARGKTSAEIAHLLGLSKRTVDFHIDNARENLGAATRVEAAIKAATGRLSRSRLGARPNPRPHACVKSGALQSLGLTTPHQSRTNPQRTKTMNAANTSPLESDAAIPTTKAVIATTLWCRIRSERALNAAAPITKMATRVAK
jgi:DNA-binding NarL/FixJ family response regulator